MNVFLCYFTVIAFEVKYILFILQCNQSLALQFSSVHNSHVEFLTMLVQICFRCLATVLEWICFVSYPRNIFLSSEMIQLLLFASYKYSHRGFAPIFLHVRWVINSKGHFTNIGTKYKKMLFRFFFLNCCAYMFVSVSCGHQLLLFN